MPVTRAAIPKRTRFEVFKRDGFRCTYCGRRPPEVMLVVDHVVPVVEGGDNHGGNLTSSCSDCNAGKGGIPLGSVLPAIDEEAIAEAMQELAERRMALTGYYAEQLAMAQDLESIVEQAEILWNGLIDGGPDEDNWRQDGYAQFERRSIVNFARRGLGVPDFRLAIEVVGTSWACAPRNQISLWRHFCKLCWDAIREADGMPS